MDISLFVSIECSCLIPCCFVCFPVKLKYSLFTVQEKWKLKAKTVSGLGRLSLFCLGKNNGIYRTGKFLCFSFFDLLHFSGNQTENWDMVFR